MDLRTQPTSAKRVAAGATLLLILLISVISLSLIFTNLRWLLVVWLGLLVVVMGLTFWLKSTGGIQVVWLLITVSGVIVTLGSLVWLAVSFPLVLLAVIAIAIAVAFLGSFALSGKAPTVGRLTPKRPVLFVNPKSGGGKASDADIAAIATERGIHVRVLERGDDLTELARNAIADGADVIGAAGGDGSLGYVATATIEAGIPFICIPAGTRNHFARDLGLDRSDIVGALDSFDGEIRMIDYGTVNDRVYLNVASLGIYAETVSDPAYRDAKIETTTKTLRSIAETGQTFDLRFADQNGQPRESADLIMVSVNKYQSTSAPADVGKRARLDSGHLGIVTFSAPDTATIFATLKVALASVIHRRKGLERWEEGTFAINSGSVVPLGIDGETVSMEPPLNFRSHAREFAVAVPVGTPYGPRVSPLGTVGGFRRLWAVAAGKSPK